MNTHHRSLVRRILQKDSIQELSAELKRISKEEPDLRIPIREIARTAVRYKLGLRREFGKALERVYASYLRQCLSSRTMNAQQKKSLHHLKLILGLSDSTVGRIHNQVARSVYRANVDNALRDGGLDARERSFLKSLQHDLKLSDEIAQRIYRDQAADLVQRSIVEALSDERLSPVEEKELHALARSLGATIEYDERTKAILDKYRLYWLIENGEIPAIEVGVRLRKEEQCYFSVDADWCEIHAASKLARFSGWNHQTEEDIENEDQPEQDHLEEERAPDVTQVDSGKLYLTSQRVLFKGKNGSRTIAFSAIRDVVPVEYGIHVHRKSGKSPFLRFHLGVDVFALMLGRLLRDFQS